VEGYLQKKKPTGFGGYQKRYVRLLEGRYVCYSENDQALKPNGVFDLAVAGKVDEKDGLA